MSVARLLLLGLLAGVLVALSLALTERGSSQIVAEGYWLPDVGNQIEQLRRIEIYAGSNDAVVSLRQQESHWRVEQLDGYPAKLAQLAGLVRELSQARLLEPRTADVLRHARLHVDDPRQPGAAGVLVQLHDASGVTDQLVIGQRSEFGTVVRRLAEDQAWLVDQPLSVPTDPMAWVDDLILNLPSRDVDEIRFSAGAERYSLQRNPARQWELSPLPEGREPLAQTSLARVSEALSGLRAREIARLAQGEQAPAVLAEVVFVYSDATQLAVKRLHLGDTDWVAFEVIPSSSQAPLADWQEMAERLSPWRFRLPGYKIAAIFRAQEALLRELPEG